MSLPQVSASGILILIPSAVKDAICSAESCTPFSSSVIPEAYSRENSEPADRQPSLPSIIACSVLLTIPFTAAFASGSAASIPPAISLTYSDPADRQPSFPSIIACTVFLAACSAALGILSNSCLERNTKCAISSTCACVTPGAPALTASRIASYFSVSVSTCSWRESRVPVADV